MNLVRKQRRVGGKKQNYWLCTETGAEFLKKPVRAKETAPRRERSDKKAISSNNRAVVVMSLLARDEIKLVDALLAKNDLEGLQLVGQCKDLSTQIVRLVCSAGFSRKLGVKTLRKFSGASKEFMRRFYSDVEIPPGVPRLNLRAYTRVSIWLDEEEFDIVADAKAYEEYKRGLV